LVNAAQKPGEWQTYDIVFTAPRFQGEKLVQPAYFTKFWSGVLAQYHKASLGPTKHWALAAYDSPESTGPLALQFHHSHGKPCVWYASPGQQRLDSEREPPPIA
jgi:hypothetical protein